MLRHLATASLAATVVSSLALVASPAQAAASGGCVTRSEYRAVHKNLTMAATHRVFGTTGKRMAISTSGGYGAQVRTYTVCRQPYSAVSISFDKNPGGVYRLAAKTAVWTS